MREEYANLFSPLEIDAVGEILNISLGSSATAISNMLDKRVDITTPNVTVQSYSEFEFSSLEPAVGVEITYTKGLNGNNIMLLKRNDVKAIVELLMGIEIPEEEFELDEMNISAICEVMNQMMGAASTALAEFLGEPVDISTPFSFEVESAEDFKQKYFSMDEPMVVVRFRLNIESTVESEFLNLIPVELAKVMIKNFGLSMENDMQQAEALPVNPPTGVSGEVSAEDIASVIPEFGNAQPQAQPQAQQAAAAPAFSGAKEAAGPLSVAEPKVIQAHSSQAAPSEPLRLDVLRKNTPANLDMVMSLPLQISVEIGRTRKTLKEILDFTQGSLVVLDKMAGETVDLYVNGQCVAKGNVVVVDDSFGVRITSIVKKPVADA